MVNLILPKMGESVHEATIIQWLKKEGDRIEADESVLEIATDKVDSEIPSPAAGWLSKILFKEGAVVKVGTVIAEITTGVEEKASSGNRTNIQNPESGIHEKENGKTGKQENGPAPPYAGKTSKQVIEATSNSTPSTRLNRVSSSGKFFSPLVRNIAKHENISSGELDTLTGSGANNRVTKSDILKYLEQRNDRSAAATPTAPATDHPMPTGRQGSPVNEGDEIIEMDRMRKMIAEHMVMSKHVSPHVTSFVEADVTGVVQWREKIKLEFEQKYREKLTYTPIFVEAVIRAIKDFPMINSSVEGTRLIVRKNINIGVAAALPSGNLIVPVIRNADHLNLLGLAAKVNDLSKRARENKLQPDEVAGGTFTISNVGTFGNLMGTPIINQPQAAILATGVIKKKPVVIETASGDTIGIRHIMYLSLSYDHRIIDGALGGGFLKRIADYLEKTDMNRSI